MGTPEIVVNRAWPCSSTLTPVGAPIGRSADLSIAGESVFSAHSFSAAEGCRFSKTSTIGLSATCSLDGLFSGIVIPVFFSDHRGGNASGQGASMRLKRPVGQFHAIAKKSACAKVPTPSHISTRRKPHGKDAATTLRGRREIRAEKNSCK